ncbi:MAG: hypothetical protein JW732_09380 [Dehalococcoidia bacterium]|nr:hypothetical protein [Dehalococcoidia bacterium]
MQELVAIYPNPGGFIDYTAAARINGYLGGNGTLEALEGAVKLFWPVSGWK